MDFCDLKFDELVETSEEYSKVIIVHPTVHFFFFFFFFFVYVIYLNIVSYSYGKQIMSNIQNKSSL